MRWKARLALAACSLMLGGCYLGHLASGQLRLWRARIPVQRLLADAGLDPAVRERLLLVAEVRAFADALGLAAADHYRHYAEWPGESVVVSLVSTRPGELEPVTSWFPIVGAVPYRGYFDSERAAREAERRRERGLDVCEVKVRAYSTLGWFTDPLTGPMLRLPEAVLVETVFHELLHATVFAPGQAAFNEGVATFVGQEARVRFYAAREGAAGALRERRAVESARGFQTEIGVLRDRVQALYAESPAGAARRAERQRLEALARQRLEALAEAEPAIASARHVPLGDACLALAGTYHADLALWSARLDSLDGDLAAFVSRAARAAEAADPRAALLRSSVASLP